MDHLFSPWRYRYVTESKPEGCVLCRLAHGAPDEDARGFIVHRGRAHYVVLNIYPYTPGHLMIVPYEHAGALGQLADEARNELLRLAVRAETVLNDVYRPEGINLGMNLGRCAGAGLEDHLHLHAVPRWFGDSSFMTVTGETRVLPEKLDETWRKLKERW